MKIVYNEYKESMELGNNIILDFDKQYVPVALEILDASKVLGIDRFVLKKDFGLDMQIGINQDSITISATFKVFKHQKLIDAPVNAPFLIIWIYQLCRPILL
jgi:uncharacterized protein YuzE